MLIPTKSDDRKSTSGIIALSPRRHSTQRKAANRTTPATSATIASIDQPLRPAPIVRLQVRRPSDTAARSAPCKIDLPLLTEDRIADISECQTGRTYSKRDVEQEYPTPSEVVDQPAAQHGPNGAADGADRRPGADRPAARFARKGASKDRKAAWQEKCSTCPLKGARHEEPNQVRRCCTQSRTYAKQGDPKNQHAAPTETIARRAPKEQQSAERQEVGIDHPLEIFCIAVQALADGG